ncbi:MAG: tetratricopeptide repeat protein [Gemmatimonadetes bacterium]|nr:tetratricopeptide repeat protein [Gemmatimonadota bacterium]NIO31766.1 tetratricopeptide repeat protein [Gemmatimonadota bacterium]
MDGKTPRSLQSLSEEVATNPSSTAFVELAAAYRERGDTERALRLCLRGLQRHPTHVEAHFELGLIYEARGERELALDEWGIVRQLAPDHVASRLALIRLYLDEKRYIDAEIELNAARELAPADNAVAELWQALEAARRDAAPDQTEGAASADLFAALEREQPGTLGVMLVGGDGQLLEGRMTRRGAESDRMLGVTLNGAKSEATRVADYLGLGELQGIVIESAVARLTVSPVSDGVVIVATRAEVPAGQAARLVQRARQIAETHLDDKQR